MKYYYWLILALLLIQYVYLYASLVSKSGHSQEMFLKASIPFSWLIIPYKIVKIIFGVEEMKNQLTKMKIIGCVLIFFAALFAGYSIMKLEIGRASCRERV